MTHHPRINPASILIEEEQLIAALMAQWLIEEEAKRQSLHFIKTKYNQLDS